MSKSFLTGLRQYFSGSNNVVTPAPAQRLALSDKDLEVSLQSLPLALTIGRQQLHIYPDIALDPEVRDAFSDIILYDPNRYNISIGSLLRLSTEQTLNLTQCAIERPFLFSRPQDVIKSQVQISYQTAALAIKMASSEHAYITVLDHDDAVSSLLTRRQKALYRLAEIYGGPLERLPPPQ